MKHPPPSELAVAHCPSCARPSLATHVNAEDKIAPRYCRVCGGVLGVAIYTWKRTVTEGGPR